MYCLGDNYRRAAVVLIQRCYFSFSSTGCVNALTGFYAGYIRRPAHATGKSRGSLVAAGIGISLARQLIPTAIYHFKGIFYRPGTVGSRYLGIGQFCRNRSAAVVSVTLDRVGGAEWRCRGCICHARIRPGRPGIRRSRQCRCRVVCHTHYFLATGTATIAIGDDEGKRERLVAIAAGCDRYILLIGCSRYASIVGNTP